MNETLAADLSEKEIFPIVDEKGNVIGKATRKECHSGSRLLHPVVHLHVLNANGDIYLQKRSIHKFIQPGKWDTAVGGHMDYGETVEQALARETREELGFTDYEPKHLFSYVYDSEVEREMVHTFFTITDRKSFDFDPAEVDEGRFWTVEEVRQAIGTGVLTPNFEEEFLRILGEKSSPIGHESVQVFFFIANDRFGKSQPPSVFGLFGFSQKIFKFLVMPSIGINFVD